MVASGRCLSAVRKTVADELERWVDEGGLDGFNLAYAITPGTVTDFIDFVVPELQRRGRAQTAYAAGTFREKLSGTPGGKVHATHPAAQFRGAYANRESVADKTTASNFAERAGKRGGRVMRRVRTRPQ